MAFDDLALKSERITSAILLVKAITSIPGFKGKGLGPNPSIVGCVKVQRPVWVGSQKGGVRACRLSLNLRL